MIDHSIRIGVVGISGKWSSECLVDAVEEKTGYRLLIDMAEVSASLSDGGVYFRGIDLTGLDAVIVKKVDEVYARPLLDRIELLRFLEASGVPVFSKPDIIFGLINRLSCSITLRAGGIPLPDTVITEDLDAAAQAVRDFGRAVLKPLFSTKARGMTVIQSDEPDWRDRLADFAKANGMIYIQKMVDIPGRDLGVAFLGGKYLATYARVGNKDSWNTTIHSGGHYEPVEPSDKILEIAHRAQGLYDLDFTCVDVAETADGPRVFEVSAFGGFRGLHDAHGIDAAAMYTDHVLASLHNSTKRAG